MGLSAPISNLQDQIKIYLNQLGNVGSDGSQPGSNFQNILSEKLNISVENFLKNKYFGKPIQIRQVDSKEFTLAQPIELVIRKDGYFFTVTDDMGKQERVKIVFALSKENTLRQQTTLSSDFKEKRLRQRFEVEQFINKSTNFLASEEGLLSSGASITLPDRTALGAPKMSEKFAQEIPYMDLTNKQEKRGMAIVLNNDIVLTDGSPLMTFFVKN